MDAHTKPRFAWTKPRRNRSQREDIGESEHTTAAGFFKGLTASPFFDMLLFLQDFATYVIYTKTER